LVTPCRERFTDAVSLATGGLGPAGYDITLAADVVLNPANMVGSFQLASAQEYFRMPPDIIAYVKDKSSWARRGVAVQNTVIEPGWSGYLTLELTNHSPGLVRLYAGTPIAQVVWHRLDMPTDSPYTGKYQYQSAGPQAAR
jgi:dCTP deaminase